MTHRVLKTVRFAAVCFAILGAAYLMHRDFERMREECSHHKNARFNRYGMREHMCISSEGAYIITE